MRRTRNVIFPSLKKKRLCKVNGPGVVDCGGRVFVDSTSGLHGRIETFSLMIALESQDEMVWIVSREIVADVGGDSVAVVGRVGECWSMSGLFSHWLILQVLGMEDRDRVVQINMFSFR
jgi:hypothetical protein